MFLTPRYFTLVVFCLFYPAEMLWGFLSLMKGFF